MIERINKIKHLGLFKNFKWNNDIPDHKQYNLVYGWNYSGKTLLSRIFRWIELRRVHLDFNRAEFELIDNNSKTITHCNFDNSPYQFRVFNSDFVKENLDWDEQEAKPLFLRIGTDIKFQKQIKSLKKEVNDLKNQKEKKASEKSNLDKDLEYKLTSKARGLNKIRSHYDRRHLKKKLEEIQSVPAKHYLNKTDVHELYRTLNALPGEELSEFSVKVLTQDKIKEMEDILDKTVISEAIERLKNNTELNNWMRKGLDLHKGKEKCEFCGGKLPKELLERYEKHFSEEYETLIKQLSKKRQELEDYGISITFYDEKRLASQLESVYKKVKSESENVINGYNESIEKLINLITEKEKNPFKKLSEKIIPFKLKYINESITNINDIIIKHNDICSNFREVQEKAFEKYELHNACEFNRENKYFDVLKRIRELEEDTIKKRNDIDKKEEEINILESQLSDIAKAADKINQYLKSIFGKEHINIVPSGENKLKILRDNIDAKNLSEGEKTAIAFSYFLTRLEDKETDPSNAIVFIDDPISSLDSNHLYNTFAVIQTKLEKCHQSFISTHNLEFFNLLKEWLTKIKGNKEKCRFYLIERITKNGDEVSDITELPALLLKFRSEYHFLFYKIKSFADNPRTDYECMYQLPNVIRRFLEAFVGFKYATGLPDGLELVISDDSDRIKVDKFVNYLSHQRGLSRSLSFCDMNECKRVVNIVLEAVRKKDGEHYGVLEYEYKNAKIYQQA